MDPDSDHPYCPLQQYRERHGREAPRSLSQVDIFVQEIGPDYPEYLLFFNEPNAYYRDPQEPVGTADQCAKHLADPYDRDTAINKAAQIYVELRTKLPSSVKMIGPNMADFPFQEQHDYETWLTDWIAAVRQISSSIPLPDGYGFHIYFYHSNPNQMSDSYLRNQMISFRNLIEMIDPGKEIWLTEFGVDRYAHNSDYPNCRNKLYCPEVDVDAVRRLTDSVSALEDGNLSFVNRYAYYTTRHKFGDINPQQHWTSTNDTDLYMRDQLGLSPLGVRYRILAIEP